MSNFKLFDPNSVDETLARVVTHGGDSYLMFPYINGIGATPKMNSIGFLIKGPTATVEDFLALSALIRQSREGAQWLIEFNTPWLLPSTDAAGGKRPIERARATHEK